MEKYRIFRSAELKAFNIVPVVAGAVDVREEVIMAKKIEGYIN